MAKDISGTTAATEKDNSWYRGVFLIEVDADAPDVAPTTERLGSRKITISSAVYSDELAPNGIDVGWNRLRVGGGLASVGSWSFRRVNLEQASHGVDTYFYENDEARLYWVFVTGAEVAADRIQLAHGVIEDYPWDPRQWSFDVIDGTDRDFREIPAERINLIDYPNAALDALGKVLPVPFGTVNVGPFDGAGAFAFMAPCRLLNFYTRQYAAGLYNDVYGTPYQYYPQDRRFAEILAYTQTGGSFTVDDATRKMLISPAFAVGSNDVADWQEVADGDVSAGVDLGSTYDYEVFLNGVSKASGAGVSGNQSVALTAADHADDWDLELYHIEIDAAGNNLDLQFGGVSKLGTLTAITCEIKYSGTACLEIYLDLRYKDQQTTDRQSLVIFQKVTGWEDATARYNPDGATNPVITGAGSPLLNPAHVLEAVLRAKALMNLSADEVDLTALGAAATARTGEEAAFVLDQPVSIDWLNEFGLQFRLHIFKSYLGKWKVMAQDADRTPSHTFLGGYNLAVRNPGDHAYLWEEDIQFGRTPMRDVINELILRYGLDRATGEYTKIQVWSGRHRATGTCSVVGAGSTGTLSASINLETAGVVAGDTCYVQGDGDYTVDSVSGTTATISVAVGTVNDSAAGTTFYVGPNLDGRMKRSQLRYKTESSLGRRMDSFRDEGGYTSDLIHDDDTALAFGEHIVEWRSQRRVTVALSTYMNAIDVELGDAAWIDHEWLPASKRPIQIGTLSSGVTAGATGWASANNQLLRTNDYILVDNEVCKVTSVSYSTSGFAVSRAQSGSVAAAHSSGAVLYRLNHIRWEITGDKVDVPLVQIGVEAQEMPNDYKPTGRVVASGYPDYSTATATQRVAAGWATKISGRVQEEDEYSNISYVGPDTGTYSGF